MKLPLRAERDFANRYKLVDADGKLVASDIAEADAISLAILSLYWRHDNGTTDPPNHHELPEMTRMVTTPAKGGSDGR